MRTGRRGPTPPRASSVRAGARTISASPTVTRHPTPSCLPATRALRRREHREATATYSAATVRSPQSARGPTSLSVAADRAAPQRTPEHPSSGRRAWSIHLVLGEIAICIHLVLGVSHLASHSCSLGHRSSRRSRSLAVHVAPPPIVQSSPPSSACIAPPYVSPHAISEPHNAPRNGHFPLRRPSSSIPLNLLPRPHWPPPCNGHVTAM